MTTRFRKVISIAVALVMLLSLCLSAPLTASAATVSVTVNNSGSVYTVDATVGAELPAPTERTNGMSFLGWYSDPECTEEYGAVQENETRTAYAKYPSTFIGFEGKDNYVAGTDYRDAKTDSGVVTDPTNANNKVFKLHAADMYANVTMPQYDDDNSGRYMLESNHSYTFTFKFMIPGGSSVDKLIIRMNKGDLPTGGNGRTPFGQVDYDASTLTPNTWYTWTYTYNVGDASLSTSPQLVANWFGGTTYDTDYVYFDDVVITDNDAEYDIEIDNTYTSFENCTVNYSGGFSSSTSASISTEAAHSGASSLKIAPSGQNTYRSYVYNGNKSALKLDSYTRYTISYWYMATSLAGSYTNIYLTLNGSGNVWDSNTQLNKTGIHSSTLNEWHKVEMTVTTGDIGSQKYLTAGLQTGAAGTVVYIDDVSVTATEYIGLHDYYCDFSADFSHYQDKYYASKVEYNTDNGILYFPTTRTDTPSADGAWVQHFAPYDGNSYYQLESNSAYRVVIRYKQTLATDTNTGYFAIGNKQSMPGSETINALVTNHIVGDTDWKEYTLNFTTGDVSDRKYLTMVFGSKDGTLAEFEVDYIKITKGPFLNNNGEISKNNTAAGSEIPAPSYDTNVLEFIGWYSDLECTQPFGVVRENETRTAYARYNKTVINFNEVNFSLKNTYRDDSEDYGGYQSGIVADPTDATNKVFKLHSPNIWSNIVIPSYDAVGAPGYPLAQGNEYTITVDFMLPETVTAQNITMRILGGTSSEGGSRTTNYNSATSYTYAVSELEIGKWYTYSATFTADSSVFSNPYPLISFQMNNDDDTASDIASSEKPTYGANNYLYLGNITVYNAAEFVTITTNNRGVISEVEVVVGTELESLSSLDEQNFLGWYSDPECTVPFGTVQADETRTAYAKYDTTKTSFAADSNVEGLTRIGQNYVVKLDSDTTFAVPSYDAASATALKLDASTTYAVRFIYKVLDGSAAGKFAVLGNELLFDAYTADNANEWTPGAITFTTTDATELALALTSDSNASVYIDDVLVYALDYTPEATVSAGNSTISVTKPVAKDNMQTGTVSIGLADGEQLKVNGITVTYDLYATAFSEPIQTKAMLSTGSYDIDRDDVEGNGSEFVYMVPANAKNIAVSAEFISDTETNIGIIAGSIREKSDTYSSGLRFRARIYDNDSIKKVGFILAPEKLITAAGFETLTLENAAACSAVTADATGVIYDKTDLYTDYQVILTGVDNIVDLSIQCIAYIEYEDGTVSYTDAKTQSYNSIKAAMNVVNYGITSYYSDEYEDTRNKLLQTQADGNFSFILLSDTHIDYTHTVKEGEYWYTADVGGTSPDRPLVQRELMMVIEMANTTDVDCIILGGDLIHGTASYNNSMADLEFYAKIAQKSKVPVYVNRGNHDANDYHGTPCPLSYIIDQEDWTTTLLDPASKNTAVHDANDPNSTYYYVDFENKKTRLIVLDPYNYPVISNDGIYSTWKAESWGGFNSDSAQLEWFMKVALDAEKQGWNYVLSSHSPIYGPESFNGNGNIQAVVKAFNNKTSVTIGNLTVDYTETDGTIPFSVSGHTHESSYRLYNDGDHVCINIGSGKISYYPDRVASGYYDYTEGDYYKWYYPVRYEGTYSEALFDAIVYEPDADTVTRYNFGVNPDNIFGITDTGVTVTEIAHERTDVE